MICFGVQQCIAHTCSYIANNEASRTNAGQTPENYHNSIAGNAYKLYITS